jgi:hypothetical protein
MFIIDGGKVFFMKTAVILAGGKATRLGDDMPPKAMLEVNGKTLLDHQLDWLESEGFDNVVLCLGHRHPEVKFNERQRLKIFVSVEQTPLGTGGAVKNAFSQYSPLFSDGAYVLNVDDVARVDTTRLFGAGSKIIAKPLPFSVWVENKMHPQNSALQHIGHTFLSLDDLKALPDGSFSLEKHLSGLSRIGFFVHERKWFTVNDKEQLLKAQKEL